MNRKLLALAIGAALSLPLVAQAAPSIYGQLNLSVDMVDAESQGIDEWQVNSNSSRLGVMGEEALGNGLSAVYKAEWEVAGDQAGGNDLTGRDRYLGLKGSFGTFKLGAYDSPLRSSQGMVDQFNDMNYLDMGTFITGENRMSNLIGYESPKIADAITAKLALQPGEDTLNGSDGLADVISASVAYEAGGLYLALGVDQGDGVGANAGTSRDTIRLTGTYTMDALQLGALVQTSEQDAGGSDEESLLLSAAYTMGKNVFKGQLIMSNEEFGASPDDEETLLIAAGMDHNFTQMTKAFAQLGLAQVDNINGVNGADGDDTVLTVGMQTRF